MVRIDHSINSKLQLMGHYLHDAVSTSFFPPLWQRRDLSHSGHDHEQSVMVVVDQADPDDFAHAAQRNRVSLQRQQDHLTPVTGPGGSFVQPSGWTATSFFPPRE